MTRVAIMHMGINAARQHMLASCIDGLCRFWKVARLGDDGKLLVLDADIDGPEASFYKNKAIDNCKI